MIPVYLPLEGTNMTGHRCALRIGGLAFALLSAALPARSADNPRPAANSAATWAVLPAARATYVDPPYRSYPAHALCGAHGLAIFGGLNGSAQAIDDTWLLATGKYPEWHSVPTVSVPGKRFYGSGAYDSVRDQFVVFG